MSKEELIYELIFGETDEFIIDVGIYVENLHKYDDFIDEIKDVLRKSKVAIINNSLDIDSKTVTWKLKVRK
jgi:hypothetical protein